MGGNVENEYHEEIYRLTIIDALTEIHNKRYLMEFLDRELARSSRHNRPLSLIMFDIDRFSAATLSLTSAPLEEITPRSGRPAFCACTAASARVWPSASDSAPRAVLARPRRARPRGRRWW